MPNPVTIDEDTVKLIYEMREMGFLEKEIAERLDIPYRRFCSLKAKGAITIVRLGPQPVHFTPVMVATGIRMREGNAPFDLIAEKIGVGITTLRKFRRANPDIFGSIKHSSRMVEHEKGNKDNVRA